MVILSQNKKIILNNYTTPTKQVDLAELQKLSESWKTPFFTFRSLEQGCGDVLYLLVKKEEGQLEKCRFSASQSCLITIAAANIFCVGCEGKDIQFAQNLINNCQSMLEGKEYNLDSCPDLQAFDDLVNFPHRRECLGIVIRGMSKIINR
ncbi:MAG: iron-sulfur cluster assembly scaffold protein [Candidatus Moeniiplasma glomeromycotorum]|nr:iron-sulfur cluster assembly scaffold protein [Candidatus Moeniiplasma glomeromycotorum]MCE8167748.1 iron-sulfur cluster assembly scaffold protein [Candidatus Moeniiplasma glomeromycotorum]MCE8169148.1 iron-sulfur cluster assembly scaffold protein [Candidatus Moeniiplasma glomeromycotorum]